MSSNNCYLCASDEGMLLDIFAGGGRAHCAKIETCLSVKIEKRNATSTKICHKCAYELDACSKFVQKYRETRDVREAKGKRPKGHCVLCLEQGKKGYIFELGEGIPLNNSLRKIREIFNDNVFKDQPSKLSICLNCRYNLDVLFDLKSVYQTTLDKLKDTAKEGTKTSVYARTKTSVVSRKTTYIPLPELNGDKAYGSDSSVSSAMPMRRKRGRPRKDSANSMGFRTCEQCETAVECGIDMYRYHRNGRTVCKDCWLKMDPEKVANNKRRKLGLVLKDVLLNPSKYASMYKVEKDEKGNTTFLITDDSSENEERETPLKRTRRSGQGVAKSAKEEAAVPDKKKPVKRVVSGKSSNRDDEPPAKVAVKEKTKPGAERNGVFTSDSEMMVLRTRRNSIASSEKNAKGASLSDIETLMPASKKKVGRPQKDRTLSLGSPQKTTVTRTRRSSQRAASTIETVVDKSTDKSVDKPTNKLVDKSTDKPVDKSTDKSVDKSVDKPTDKSVNKSVDKSVDKPVDKVERPVRRTRANSFTSQDSTSLASRLSGSSLSKTVRSKTKSMSPTSSASEAEPESPFACGVCKAQYKNKLLGMAHELTHSKQPEVKLQRVAIPEIIIEEAPAEPSLVEEPEEQSHDVSSTSGNGPENAESGETPVAEAPIETETTIIVDAKDETKDKADDKDEATAQIDESKDTKTTGEDNVEIIEESENEAKTKASQDREPETNDEDRKTDGDGKTDEDRKTDEDKKTDEAVNIDSSVTEESKDDEVTEERPAEDKTIIEPSVEKERAENADSVEQPAVEENEENNKEVKDKEEKDIEVKDKEEKDEEKKDRENHKEEKDEEEKDKENHKEEKDKEEHKEEKDKEEERKEENDKEEEHKEENDKEEEHKEERDKEESTRNSTEETVRANEVVAERETESEIDGAERAETAKSDVETKVGIVEARAPEESVEPESVPGEASETPESENAGGNAASVETIASDEADKKSLEWTLESAPNEAAAGEDLVVRKESESISVVTEVLREVFDLATAEVQKRLETERPNDEKCSTPVPETLENISREIENSADMPSLEPLVEDRTAADRS